MKILIPILVLFLAACASTPEPRKLYEADYRDAWCLPRGGTTEAPITDADGRVVGFADCLLPDRAVEVEFGPKWAEAPGQARRYARLTGTRPGIVFIMRSPRDEKYLWRLLWDIVDDPSPWAVWIITPEDVQ